MESSGAEIITVAVRRVNISSPDSPSLTEVISSKKYTYLPNTAGCHNAEEAVRTLRLAREAGGWELVKLEIIGDNKTLYPNMIETLKASKTLTKEEIAAKEAKIVKAEAQIKKLEASIDKAEKKFDENDSKLSDFEKNKEN